MSFINKSKKSKKINEIKIDIKDNSIIKGKTITKVLKLGSLEKINDEINKLENNIKSKLLINYKRDEYYLFKSETLSKNKKIYNDENELKNKEIASLIKSFYSEENMEWNDIFNSKKKKMKYELAPVSFDVKDNYIKSDERYINIISLESFNNELNIKELIANNSDYWIAIDFYKVDSEFILNKLNEMEKDNVIEKKFTPYITNKIDFIREKLQNEDIVQCEIKFLLYNNNLDKLMQENMIIKEQLSNILCSSYMPQERLTTRRIFEKCIYPNMNTDIVHSINIIEFINMLGGEINV